MNTLFPDSLIRISDLVEKVSERKSPSVSITDHNNIFSLVKFYKQAIKKGVKPIIGIEIDIKDTESSNESFRIVLLCKNIIGFNNLSNLITDSYVNLNENNKFIVLKDDLLKHSEGLIVLSGGIYGDLAHAIKSGKNDLIESSINYWKKNFLIIIILRLQGQEKILKTNTLLRL